MKEGILILTKNAIHEMLFHEEIIYISVQKHDIRIKLTDGSSLIAKYSLKQIEKQLPPNIFFRTHRNYIVSLRYIKGVGVDSIIVKGMKENEEIPLAKDIRNSFFGLFTVLGSVKTEGSRARDFDGS